MRTLAGGPVVSYAPTRLASRLRLEVGALRRLPDRVHDMPGQVVDATGTILYAVVVERGRWVVRPALGWRSYRWLARPLASTAAIPRGDEVAAVAWARAAVADGRLRSGAA